MVNELEKNKRFYKIYSISKQSLFIWTIFLIYLNQKGLTFTEAMFLTSISGITTFILEIPSGIIADRLNRKKILVFGEGINLLSFIIILISNNFYILIFSYILFGVSEALISGCGESLIYESFYNVNEQENYKSYIANVQMVALRFSAIATLLAGFLYKINMNLPLILSIIIQLLLLVALTQTIDSRIINNSNYNIGYELKVQLKNIKDIFFNKSLLKLFLIYTVMTIIISNINYTSQAYLPSIGIDYIYIGIIFFIFNIISSFGAKYSIKVNLQFKLLLGIYSILLIALCFSGKYLSLIILAISRFINGMIWPILNNDINKKISNDNRATILSYKSLMVQTSFIIFDPIVGFSIDSLGFKYTYLSMGIVITMIFFAMIITKKFKSHINL